VSSRRILRFVTTSSPDGEAAAFSAEDGRMEILKVSSRSNPNAVAGAMAGVVRQSGAVEVQVVGAGALNQAVKALAIARGFVAEAGLDLVCVPTFADIEIDGERRTAIRLCIDDRSGRVAPTEVTETTEVTVDVHADVLDLTGERRADQLR
jgi:stage V sporulation protein S